MERTYTHVKRSLLTFKLDYCCWLAPIRAGLCIIAYLNVLLSLISLIGIADENFSPPIVKIQETLMPDFVSKPIPILAYSTELAFNAVLLSAMYRKDVQLSRVFMYYNTTTVVASALFYSMIIPAIGVLLIITIFSSLVFQIYVLILVRSAIVMFKEESAMKNGKVPTEYVFSTLKRENDVQDKCEVVVEPSTSDPELPTEEVKGDDREEVKEAKKEGQRDKLETVEEENNPNEIRVQLNP